MSCVLRSLLPREIVDIIKLFTGEGCWRRGKYINIHRIPKTDLRFSMLEKRPRIKQIHNNCYEEPFKGCVWFKTSSGKFIVIYVGNTYAYIGHQNTFGCFWEMHYNQERTLLYIG